jgi:hypothetical protein
MDRSWRSFPLVLCAKDNIKSSKKRLEPFVENFKRLCGNTFPTPIVSQYGNGPPAVYQVLQYRRTKYGSNIRESVRTMGWAVAHIADFS